MSRGTIHVFNPETEYALACGDAHYTPPASVVRLRRENCLLPALWAAPGDAILLSDRMSDDELTALPYHDVLVDKRMRLLRHGETLASFDRPAIRPWGWNASLCYRLRRMGVAAQSIPAKAEIDAIRCLAHRRFTRRMLMHIGMDAELLPVEFDDADAALEWCGRNIGGYLKAPWSSSGRGIFRVLEAGGEDLQGWIRGVIRRQGTLVAEIGWDRIADFATEWWLHAGRVRFMGYSLFEVDAHSQYRRNLPLSQQEIYDTLCALGWSDDILALQMSALEELVAPRYSGPLGIDCLADLHGRINPCVEMNVRMTMGLAHILSGKSKLSKYSQT